MVKRRNWRRGPRRFERKPPRRNRIEIAIGEMRQRTESSRGEPMSENIVLEKSYKFALRIVRLYKYLIHTFILWTIMDK
jgi:hypothetical protein